MKLSEIIEGLELLKGSHIVLDVYKTGYFQLIMNTNVDHNIGFDLQFDSINKRLEIAKFRKEPYKRIDVFSLLNGMTTKQADYIKKFLIENYFKHLDYLI